MLTVGGFARDSDRIALLASRGYTHRDTFLHHMQVLPGRVPDANEVAGYRVRRTRPSDLAQQALCIQAAFDGPPRTVETYNALRSGAHYRNELDLVATAPDGSVAAFAIGWLDRRARAGLLEPVGCHPNHRRRGLSRLLVTRVIHELFRLGADSTVVYTPGSNAAALSLYRSVGFRAIGDDHDWVRELGARP
jgi:ribosomal protein S18 acetylase RimI-like enzyme